MNAALGLAFLQVQGNPRNTTPPPDSVRRAVAALEALRPSTALAGELGFPVIERTPPGAARPLSRFAAWEDWDDPVWSSFSRSYATDPEANFAHRRDAMRWEQVQVLYGLDRVGMLRGDARVLAVATMPDAVIAALSYRVGRVDVFDAAAAPQKPPATPSFWAHGAVCDQRVLSAVAPGTRVEQLQEAAYDVVLFPHGAMFRDGIEVAVAWMRAAEALLRPNGVLVFKSEIAAGQGTHPTFFDAGFLADDGLPFQLAMHTRLCVDGGFDRHLSRATVDRVAPETGPAGSSPFFVTRADGRVLVPALWFVRKRETASEPQWDKLRDWVRNRRLGEQITSLQTGAAGIRDRRGISTRPRECGHVFYGPYLRTSSGSYRAAITVAASGVATNRRISEAVLEAVADGEIIATRFLEPQNLRSGLATLEFEIARATGTGADPILEIRLFSPGGIAVCVTSVDLQLREPRGVPVWPLLPPSGACSTNRELHTI
jgi:hypothetical protein